MLKIIINVNKQDVALSFTTGQTFPELNGKLISVEASGKELQRLLEKREIPLCQIDNSCLTWHGRHASRVLRDLKELFDK